MTNTKYSTFKFCNKQCKN